MADVDKTFRLHLSENVTRQLTFLERGAIKATDALNKYADRLEYTKKNLAEFNKQADQWAREEARRRAAHEASEKRVAQYQAAANREFGLRAKEHVSALDRINQAYSAVRYSAMAAGAAFAVHKLVDVAKAAVELDNFSHKVRVASKEIALMKVAGEAAGLATSEVTSSIERMSDALIDLQKPFGSQTMQRLQQFTGGMEFGQKLQAQMAKDGGNLANTMKMVAEYQAVGGDHAKRVLTTIFGMSYEYDKIYKVMGRMVQPKVLDPEQALELSIQWRNARTHLENMGKTIAAKVIPELAKMMERLSTPENVENLTKTFEALLNIAGAVATAVDSVAKALGGYDRLTYAVIGLVGAWKLLNIALAVTDTKLTTVLTTMWAIARHPAFLAISAATYLGTHPTQGTGKTEQEADAARTERKEQRGSGFWEMLGFGGGNKQSTPGRATGGSVRSGSAYTVGERGAETFMPGQSGTIVPGSIQGQLAQQEILREEQVSNKTLDEIRELLEKQLEELEAQGEGGGASGGGARGGGGRRGGGGGRGGSTAGAGARPTADSQGGPAGPMGGGIPPSVAAQADQAAPSAGGGGATPPAAGGGQRSASLGPSGGGGVPAPGPPGTGDQTGGGIPASIIEQARAVAVGKNGGLEGVRNFMQRSKYPQSGAWCGKFAANVVMAAGGTPPKDPEIASNWRNFGKRVEGAPQPGDIAVAKPGWSRRGSGRTGDIGSHVTIVDTGIDPKTGKFGSIGGNQSSVRSKYNARQFDFFRGGQVPPTVAAAGANKVRQPAPSPAKPVAVETPIPPQQESIRLGDSAAGPSQALTDQQRAGLTPEPRAMGGSIFSGRQYMVGERGAETFLPDMPSGSGGVPANILAQARQVAASGKQGDVDKFMAAQGYPRSSAWCGKFMAATMKASGAGYAVPAGFETASNWRNVAAPRAAGEQQPGDIAVSMYDRKTGKPVATGMPGSHVTTYEGFDPNDPNKFLGYGGNQGGGSGRVKSSSFDTGKYQFFPPPTVVGAGGPEMFTSNVSGQMMPNTNSLDRALRQQMAGGGGGDLGTARLEIDVRGNAKTSLDTANSVFADTQLNKYPQMGQAYE